MRPASARRGGFTLVETLMAVAVLGTVVVVVIAGLLQLLRSIEQSSIQDELDIDVQTAMERIKHDLRLSSLDRMFFSPQGPGPYTAISFPLARDDDGDGAVERDEEGHIIWDQTVVYHVWGGEPNQLRLTVFDPRDNTLTDAERQVQVDRVVLDGNGPGAPNGAHAVTRVLFENLFRWSISPRGAVLDAYAPVETREVNVNLGSVSLGPGTHHFQFTVLGKNSASSGYRVGVDSLFATPSAARREGENLLPAWEVYGPVPTNILMEGGSWSGNYHLLFPATAAGQYFTLAIDNDRWEETNFQQSGDVHENTVVQFDRTRLPHDFVVALQGQGTNWSAEAQTGDLFGQSVPSGLARGSAVRVLLRGEEMDGGNWIGFNAARTRILFRSGLNESLRILSASLALADSTETSTMDAEAGTFQALTFSGQPGTDIPAASGAWSDLLDFPVEQTASYLVTLLVADVPGFGGCWQWTDLVSTGLVSTFVIPKTGAPDTNTVVSAAWSARGDVESKPGVWAVARMFSSYPESGAFVSDVFDTHAESPAYSEIRWNAQVPDGTSTQLKVRTGDEMDLSDAPAWPDVTPVPVYGVIDPGHGRFVQFRCELTSNAAYDATPELKDVTIKWYGPERVVDVGGTFTKGPDYGIFRVTVDGGEILTGLAADLEIFKDAPGFAAKKRITSRLAVEIQPRNTGL